MRKILSPLCFSRQDASNGISFDLVRSISKFDLRSRSLRGQVVCQTMRLDETNTTVLIPCLYVFSIKSYKQKSICDLPWPQMTLKCLLTKNCTLVITSGLRIHDPERTRMIQCLLLETEAIEHFPHWLTMVRSRHWPDPRSPIWKIRDIRFVDTNTLMNSCKFQISRINVVAWARSQTFLEVGSLYMTWWPDLRSHWAKTCRQDAKWMYEKVLKIWRRYAPPFSRYSQKPEGGGRKSAPRPVPG